MNKKINTLIIIVIVTTLVMGCSSTKNSDRPEEDFSVKGRIAFQSYRYLKGTDTIYVSMVLELEDGRRTQVRGKSGDYLLTIVGDYIEVDGKENVVLIKKGSVKNENDGR